MHDIPLSSSIQASSTHAVVLLRQNVDIPVFNPDANDAKHFNSLGILHVRSIALFLPDVIFFSAGQCLSLQTRLLTRWLFAFVFMFLQQKHSALSSFAPPNAQRFAGAYQGFHCRRLVGVIRLIFSYLFGAKPERGSWYWVLQTNCNDGIGYSSAEVGNIFRTADQFQPGVIWRTGP